MKATNLIVPNKRNAKQITLLEVYMNMYPSGTYFNYENKLHVIKAYTTIKGTEYPILVYFKGDSAKCSHYRYRNYQSSERALQQLLDGIEVREKSKKEYSERKKEKSKEVASGIEVGTLLVSSGGYEQTNVTFYQVVRVFGKKSVEVKRIRGCAKETGYLSGTTSPVKDSFISDDLIKGIINHYGVKLKCELYSSSITQEGSEHYYSSYY